jgi:hypothetical protein
MERLIEPNSRTRNNLGLVFFCVCLKVLMQGGRSSFAVRGNFCPEGNFSSAVQQFLINETLHDVDSLEK